MELTSIQAQTLLSRLPAFELSYETVSHKKVPPTNSLALAIPRGKKYYAWYTFEMNRDVCYLMELNKDRRISRITKIDTVFHPSLALGTILYGTLLENILANTAGEGAASPPTKKHSIFVIEEMYYYKGISLKQHTFSEKFNYIHDLLNSQISKSFCETESSSTDLSHTVVYSLPIMWILDETIHTVESIPSDLATTVGYHVHHIQYRNPYSISPYLNVIVKKIGTAAAAPSSTPSVPSHPGGSEMTHVMVEHTFDYSKPHYKYPCVFQVMADIQFDIYHLYAHDEKTQSTVYVQSACIPNYKTSVFMNGLFRRIRENVHLDYIEESDDEADFENTAFDKHVNLSKKLMMECVFHAKFKKWTPTRVLSENAPMVSLSKLVRSSDSMSSHPKPFRSYPQQEKQVQKQYNHARR